MWHVYIIKCRDGKLYTGITTDIDRRIREHNSGQGSNFTRARRPVTLAYSEEVSSRSKALKREAGIRKLKREEKLALI